MPRSWLRALTRTRLWRADAPTHCVHLWIDRKQRWEGASARLITQPLRADRLSLFVMKE